MPKKRNRPSLTSRLRRDWRLVSITPAEGYDEEACKFSQAATEAAPNGSYVKLGLRSNSRRITEWMWFRMENRKGKIFQGTLINYAYEVNAQPGMRLSFKADNVFTVDLAA